MENQKAKLQLKKKRKQNTWGKKERQKGKNIGKHGFVHLHFLCIYFAFSIFFFFRLLLFLFLAWKKAKKKNTQNQSKKTNRKSKINAKNANGQVSPLFPHFFPIVSPFWLSSFFMFPPFFPLLFCFCVFWILLMCFLFVPCFFLCFCCVFFSNFKQVGISYGLVDIILFLIPVFPASLLFCCSCFSVFVAFLLLCSFCFSAFPRFAFPASLFFCSFSSVPFYCSTTFSCSAVMRFCCSASSCSFASLLPSLLYLCFSFPFALFSPACILNEVLEKP